MWIYLKPGERRVHCATDGCEGQPLWRLEVDGIGSVFCSGCRDKIKNREWAKRQATEFARNNPE